VLKARSDGWKGKVAEGRIGSRRALRLASRTKEDAIAVVQTNGRPSMPGKAYERFGKGLNFKGGCPQSESDVVDLNIGGSEKLIG